MSCRKVSARQGNSGKEHKPEDKRTFSAANNFYGNEASLQMLPQGNHTVNSQLHKIGYAAPLESCLQGHRK